MRNKNKRPSSSRDRKIRKRKKDIAIRERSSSTRNRSKRRKKQMKKIYMRRRIILALGAFLIVFGIGKFVYNKITSYNTYSYPAFREEVRNSLGEEVFVGSTGERSLTTAEKLDDLDILYKNITRNYGIRASNRDDFNNFVKDYESTKKKVEVSKTDQEYFDIIMSYINILGNQRTRLVDKKSYDDLLKYYKNHPDTEKSQIIQNPQAVDRYKRMIAEKNIDNKTLFTPRNNVLLLSMNDFYLGNINKDIKEFTEIINNNQSLSKILIDLTDNTSLDDLYWQKFLPLLAHKDYSYTGLVFYRGNLIKKTLEDMKNKSEEYGTSFIQNQSIKYPEKINDINLEEYMYYDEFTLNIKNNPDFKKMGIYVLTNDSTSNEAIMFANALKKSAEAVLIKNTSQSETTANDLIKNFPADYFILEHSGLLVSIDNSFGLEKESPYINYDQFINTDNPVEAVLSTL